ETAGTDAPTEVLTGAGAERTSLSEPELHAAKARTTASPTSTNRVRTPLPWTIVGRGRGTPGRWLLVVVALATGACSESPATTPAPTGPSSSPTLVPSTSVAPSTSPAPTTTTTVAAVAASAFTGTVSAVTAADL